MKKTHWPLIGIAASLCLFLLSATYYPGGTTEDTSSTGYDWTRNYISTLFSSTALNGEPNPARNSAIPAMLLLCTSIAYLFSTISKCTNSSFLRRSIEIGGIGAMVYAFLAVVTPIHDLLVSFSSLFFLVAVVAILVFLYQERRRKLLGSGVLCLGVSLASGVMYYGNTSATLLPIAQKLTFSLSASWLLACYYGLAQKPDKPTD